MQARLDPFQAAPEIMQALLTFSAVSKASNLELALKGLVKVRASQINGCAYCIHMHTREARAEGESEERLHLLDAWRESPLYTPRERAALAWTEALTRIADTHAPDDAYDAARAVFTEKELVELTVGIGLINTWNRIAVGFRRVHPVEAAKASQAA